MAWTIVSHPAISLHVLIFLEVEGGIIENRDHDYTTIRSTSLELDLDNIRLERLVDLLGPTSGSQLHYH